MDHRHTSIRYRPQDHEFLSIEELSCQAHVSRAFIRLCIDLGCPHENRRLSQAGMIEWLALNYAAVRAASGLRPLASIDGVAARARRDLQLANTMLTLLEYAESRCTNLKEKKQLRSVAELIERSV